MSIKKQYLKDKPACKVTLVLPSTMAHRAQNVNVVGEFNDWDKHATSMTCQKDGSFKAVLELDKDHDYQFRYLIDNKTWMNDSEADGFIPNNLTGEENSLIHV